MCVRTSKIRIFNCNLTERIKWLKFLEDFDLDLPMPDFSLHLLTTPWNNFCVLSSFNRLSENSHSSPATPRHCIQSFLDVLSRILLMKHHTQVSHVPTATSPSRDARNSLKSQLVNTGMNTKSARDVQNKASDTVLYSQPNVIVHMSHRMTGGDDAAFSGSVEHFSMGSFSSIAVNHL
jgi:hypothetical protein